MRAKELSELENLLIKLHKLVYQDPRYSVHLREIVSVIHMTEDLLVDSR